LRTGASVAAAAKYAYDFRKNIQILIERMKSGEIYHGEKKGTIGRFARAVRRRIDARGKYGLERMVSELDRIYSE
jgi:hypothetical protein